MKLTIAHLYPDLLNLYGDRGNLLAIQRRCQWREIDCDILPVSIGDDFQAGSYDIVFIGGGQDHEQNLLHEDLVQKKGDAIREAVADGLIFLCICGGFQMIGQYYETQDGYRVPGIGALDFYTVAKPQRLIGNLVCHSDYLAEHQLDPVLVGFENHSGRTFLGPDVQPLATVTHGCGNNGEDRTEGAIFNHVYCTYAHGSFLPKNPDMTDYLIETALKKRYSVSHNLKKLDNTLEENARKYIVNCK